MLAATGLLSLSSAWPTISKRQQVCNLNSDFCDRQYSNVSFVGTHDSAFVGSIADPTVNQEDSLTDQLNAGIRFIQGQTHLDDNNVLSMCHTSCLELNAGTLQDYLSTVNSWLEANPNDVLTLLLVNGDGVAITEFDSVFSAAGITQFKFVPSTSPDMLAMDQWPTYGDLISAGTRLVAFLDSGADESTVPYILGKSNLETSPSQNNRF